MYETIVQRTADIFKTKFNTIVFYSNVFNNRKGVGVIITRQTITVSLLKQIKTSFVHKKLN